jgi:hypothetical protein
MKSTRKGYTDDLELDCGRIETEFDYMVGINNDIGGPGKSHCYLAKTKSATTKTELRCGRNESLDVVDLSTLWQKVRSSMAHPSSG